MTPEEKKLIERELETKLYENGEAVREVLDIVERVAAAKAALVLQTAYDRMTVDFDGDMDLADGLEAAKLRIKEVLDEVQKGLPLMPIRLAFPVTKEEEAKLRADAAEARKENDILRGLVAKVVGKCVYCGLEDKSKCLSGFPGCAWADDVLVGDDVFVKDLVVRLRKAEACIADWIRWGADKTSEYKVALEMKDAEIQRQKGKV